jgi:hypothetical protein
MFWYKLGRFVGYITNLLLLAYIGFDAYTRYTKSESLMLDILVIFLLSGYNVLIERVSRIMHAAEYMATYMATQQYVDQQKLDSDIRDFEKLLNDFGQSDWTLDKD